MTKEINVCEKDLLKTITILKTIRIICFIPLLIIMGYIFLCDVPVSEFLLWVFVYFAYLWYVSIPSFIGISVTTVLLIKNRKRMRVDTDTDS